jgi:hypothetical protein
MGNRNSRTQQINQDICPVNGCNCGKKIAPLTFQQSYGPEVYTVAPYTKYSYPYSYRLLYKLVLLTNKYPLLNDDIEQMLHHTYFNSILNTTVFKKKIACSPILSYAARYSGTISSESTVRMLLRCGANPYKEDFECFTPITYAMKYMNKTSTPETCNILHTEGIYPEYEDIDN